MSGAIRLRNAVGGSVSLEADPSLITDVIKLIGEYDYVLGEATDGLGKSWRFDNGVLIAFRQKSSQVLVTTASGSLYYTNTAIDISAGAIGSDIGFLEPPYVTYGESSSSGITWCMQQGGAGPTTTSVSIHVVSGSSIGTAVPYCMMTGRWK